MKAAQAHAGIGRVVGRRASVYLRDIRAVVSAARIEYLSRVVRTRCGGERGEESFVSVHGNRHLSRSVSCVCEAF